MSNKRLPAWESDLISRLPEGLIKIYCYHSVDSTMTLAKQLLLDNPLEQPVLIMSRHQSQGKGRRGRSWESAENAFLGTYLFKSKERGFYVQAFSLVVGLSIYQALNPEPGKFYLKWPNDLLNSHAQKVAGVLLEHHALNHGDYLAIGIGVNLKGIPEDQPTASDVYSETGQDLHPSDFAVLLTEKLSTNLEIFNTNGFEVFKKQWESHSYPLGSRMQIVREGQTLKGGYRGIDTFGRFQFEMQGEVKSFSSLEVEKVHISGSLDHADS